MATTIIYQINIRRRVPITDELLRSWCPPLHISEANTAVVLICEDTLQERHVLIGATTKSAAAEPEHDNDCDRGHSGAGGQNLHIRRRPGDGVVGHYAPRYSGLGTTRLVLVHLPTRRTDLDFEKRSPSIRRSQYWSPLQGVLAATKFEQDPANSLKQMRHEPRSLLPNRS